MHKTAAALLLATGVGAASAQLSIKDFVLGEDLQAAAAKAGMSCTSMKESPGRFCYSLATAKPDLIATIAGVPAKRVIINGLDDGKLGAVRYSFTQSGFAIVRAAFTDKYPQMKCDDSIVENRMGAKFDQTVCQHASADGTVTLKRRASDLTEGEVEIRSAAYMAGFKEWIEKRKAEGKKDI